MTVVYASLQIRNLRGDNRLESVAARGIRPVLVGLLGGLAVAVSFGRLLEGQLFGVSPLDPISIVAGILILSAFSGSLPPAWRASRADPLQAIRME